MEDENVWVFDSLVCFLNGPIWNAPLQSFIEEKSLIFEPNVQSDEYKKIFDEFKNLVDFMLGNFMEDIGITPEQFESACKEGKKYPVSFDHNLFEQIWAANDYEMFKKMMTQRNVELQLQALELIERKYGITPQSFIPKNKSEEEAEEKEKATATIKEASVVVEKNSALEEEVINEVKKHFPEEEPSTSALEVKTILEQKEELKKTLQRTKSGDNKENVADKQEENVINEIKEEKEDRKENTVDEIKKQPEIDAVELKKRQEFLRAQRDKLVALKKEARRKQLGKEGDRSKGSRPRSAKAAERVLDDGPPEPPQRLLVRKSLAERLRSEVVGRGQAN